MESDLGKLFIGGISWDTDEDRLREYFSKFGEVIEAVIMRDRATGRARGFGFIVFADPLVAERVIMNKHMIDGRTVEAKKAVPRDDQHVLKRHVSPIHHSSPGHGGGGGGRTKKIFVGGLPSSITESEFKNYFDQFGTITDVVVMYDHNTQRPRGFGFITFDSEDAVDRVLHKTFHELIGKRVEVKRAVPKELSTASSNRSPLLGYGNYGGSNRSANNSYFNNFAPGYNLSSVGGVGRFSPIGSGRSGFSGFGNAGFGLGVNPELSLNPNYDGTTSTFGNNFGYNRILSNPYYNGASPNRYNTPIGYNRNDSAYNLSNRGLWGNSGKDSSGRAWNLGVSLGNNRGNWGLSSVTGANSDNSYGRNIGTGSGFSASPFAGPDGYEGSVGELYRGGGSIYSDSTWQQPPASSAHDQLDGSSRSFGYGIGSIGSDPSADGSEGYPGGYNVGSRQTNRGIAA